VRQSPAVAAAALDDLQPFGNPLRIAPKRVVDKAFEQIRRQQACERLDADGAAHGMQARGAGAFVEFGDVIVAPTMPSWAATPLARV